MGKRKTYEVTLYTDGACSGNPGPGGWAFILVHPISGKRLARSGAEAETTNNRMELQAVIEGLSALQRPTSLELVTDSEYVRKGLMEWMHGWKAAGWKKKGSPLKNVELWKKLDLLVAQHDILFTHVDGHSGHPENESCDAMAVAAYQPLVADKRRAR